MNSEYNLAKIVGTGLKIHQVKINSYTINYITMGKGEPVLLLHGLNIGWGEWYPNIAALSKQFTVYAVEYIEVHGSTSRPSCRRTKPLCFSNRRRQGGRPLF